MGNGQVSRYIGGKRPQKYFQEDVWPDCENILRKLNIDEARGLEIFKVFCKIDVDESETLEIDECMNFFGGKRTKFTERLFSVLEDCNKGLDFLNFSYTVWNFCTLNVSGVARFIFEIFDPDNNFWLEQADIEAIYRMLYDTNDHDIKHITVIKYDDQGRITKEKFIKHMRSKKFIIKPALDYQKRVRRMLGGLIMWEGLTGYRKRHFSVYDTKSTTLEDSFRAIIASPNLEETPATLDAAEQLAKEREQLSTAVNEAQQRMLEFKRFRDEEKRKQQANIEDRAVSLAWMAFEAKKYEFEATVYTMEDIIKRQEDRNQLYEVFDQATSVQNEYWLEKGRKEELLAFGHEADKETKVKDVLSTEQGALDYQRLKWMLILETTMKRMLLESSSEKVRGDVATLQQQHEKLEQGSHNFHAVKKLSDKFSKKFDFVGIEEKAKERFASWVIDSAIQEMRDKRQSGIEERAKEIRRKEFDIITKYGARNTRWETVHDTVHDRMVTINVDTMRILNNKACICEFCDAIIEENDLRCFNCSAGRSVKNAPLYRPLGGL